MQHSDSDALETLGASDQFMSLVRGRLGETSRGPYCYGLRRAQLDLLQ